jgi:hypothetical protein
MSLKQGKCLILNGGADRDRTDDLLNAIQALSQLSYSPTVICATHFDLKNRRPVASTALLYEPLAQRAIDSPKSLYNNIFFIITVNSEQTIAPDYL